MVNNQKILIGIFKKTALVQDVDFDGLQVFQRYAYK